MPLEIIRLYDYMINNNWNVKIHHKTATHFYECIQCWIDGVLNKYNHTKKSYFDVFYLKAKCHYTFAIPSIHWLKLLHAE